MKIFKLIFLTSVILNVSLLFSQQDSVKQPPLTVKVKNNTNERKIPPVDSLHKDELPQDTPDSSGFFIESKSGTSNLRIYSSIRLYGAYDFNGLKGGTSFSINKIPTGSENKNEESFFMTANLTKFGLQSNYQTFAGKIFMHLEADFSNEDNYLRIRYAYGRTDFLLAGQAWTVFSDNRSIPNTVDADGPPTSVLLRTVQIRLFKGTLNGWFFKGSIESPKINISIPDTIVIESASQVIPDFAASASKTFKFGHLQLAGIFRVVSARALSGELDNVTGYGGLLSGRFDLGRKFGLMFQMLGGKGITSFLKLSQNSSFDIIFNPSTGGYEPLTSYGGFITLTKEFPVANLKSSLIFGTVNIINKDFEPDDVFQSGYYISFNTFWFSIFGFRIGFEYNFGYSLNKKGNSGTANRFAFTYYYDF